MKKMTWAELKALSIAEREEIRDTAQGISVCTVFGIDYWALTPAAVTA